MWGDHVSSLYAAPRQQSCILPLHPTSQLAILTPRFRSGRFAATSVIALNSFVQRLHPVHLDAFGKNSAAANAVD